MAFCGCTGSNKFSAVDLSEVIKLIVQTVMVMVMVMEMVMHTKKGYKLNLNKEAAATILLPVCLMLGNWQSIFIFIELRSTERREELRGCLMVRLLAKFLYVV